MIASIDFIFNYLYPVAFIIAEIYWWIFVSARKRNTKIKMFDEIFLVILNIVKFIIEQINNTPEINQRCFYLPTQ